MRLLSLPLFAAPVLAQTLPKKQLVEEVRLDPTTEDFPDAGSVLANSRGEMAVFVNKDQQFRFYDASGRKLGVFGRIGSGPGEIGRILNGRWPRSSVQKLRTRVNRHADLL